MPPLMQGPVDLDSSGGEDGPVGSRIGSQGPGSPSLPLATSGDMGNLTPEPNDKANFAHIAREDMEDAQSEGTPPGTLALLEQIRARRLARDSRMWDVEDAELEAAQLREVALPISHGSSDSEDSSSTDFGLLCPVRRAPSSIEFDNISSVPYHAQYKRVVEQEEDAEMERLLQQLDQEQQAIHDLAVAQRYQLMQEQIAVIQKQLGRGDAKIPDLEWLMANDPENNHELDDIMAAFAARDDDLPQEAPEEPEIPLTCRNIFYACRLFRALTQHPVGTDILPVGDASIYRRYHEFVLGEEEAEGGETVGTCIFDAAIDVSISDELLPPGLDSDEGSGMWSNPYNIFTTTSCGPFGIRVKVEHSSKTHVLNEEVFGTVAFIGLSRANTWDIMGLLDLAYEHDFDAIAITPPGHGNTTQVEDEGGGFWSSSNFLKHALESCLGVSLARTVVVSHSNFVTRKYFLPFLMSDIALGFVLFDSSVGTDWMDEYDTDVNDHKFYQYVGKRRLAGVDSIIHSLETKREDFNGGNQLGGRMSVPSEGLQLAKPRVLAATSLKGYCRAEPEGADDAFPTNSTLGPFDFFPGKYKMPGWDTARKRFRETPLDAPADEGMEGRLVSSEYFDPLRIALVEFLEDLKSLSLGGKLQVEQPRPLRYNNRQTEYDKSREHTTTIDPMTVYCVQESAASVQPTRSSDPNEAPPVHLVDPEKYWLQKKAQTLRSTSTTTASPSSTAKKLTPVKHLEFHLPSLGSILSNWVP
ncbi:uncharacterized protein EMH_0006240 [Eimeria mitis]|uniref:Uncharacterized protein n=1 Tax=Eimeria mitis TaxID=44415 RepID=U6KFP1_9EIME|nr:uncharacterized protein EMH_0006240 [Eimeria mitis]CDJ35601.1 hypothetical protein, conserved [Eimeria mitis]